MKNKLFDIFERSDYSISKYETPRYDFLNNSARDEPTNIRETLTEWYNSYPSKEQNEFLGRFRSKDNQHFLGAFLELYVFQLFKSFGYSVDKTDNSCDLKASLASKSVFLECTLSGDPLHNDMVEKQVNMICDRLDTLKSKYLFCLSVEQFNNNSPAYGKLERFLNRKINEVNYQDVVNRFSTNREWVTWDFNNNGWTIRISLIPKSEQIKNSNEIRNMGIINSGKGGFINSHKHVLDAIQEKKPSRYGKFSDPYVIVINSLDATLEDNSITETLFGNQNSTYGFFGNQSKPKNTSVSGVLIFKGLYPYGMHNPKMTYWANPWAKFPVNDFWPIDQYFRLPEQSQNEFRNIFGESPESLFDKMKKAR